MSETIPTTNIGRFLSWWRAVQKERRRAKVQGLIYAALGTDHDEAEALMRNIVGLWNLEAERQQRLHENFLNMLTRHPPASSE